MKRKPSKFTILKRRLQSLAERCAKVQSEVGDLEYKKYQAEEELRILLVSVQFKNSQISFSKRLLFDIERDARVQLSNGNTTSKKFLRLLDEEIFRLIHGGRKPNLIMVSPSGVMEKLNVQQVEARGRFNYAGIPVTFCDSIRKNCFIIQSQIGKTNVAGERGWAEVATAGYNQA